MRRFFSCQRTASQSARERDNRMIHHEGRVHMRNVLFITLHTMFLAGVLEWRGARPDRLMELLDDDAVLHWQHHPSFDLRRPLIGLRRKRRFVMLAQVETFFSVSRFSVCERRQRHCVPSF